MTQSPALKPYPSWSAHRMSADEVPEIISPFRVRADACGRLWVLDTGVENIVAEANATVLSPTRLLVYDLHNDNLLRSYKFPEDHIKDGSFFASIAVEDEDCDDSFAYSADLGKPGLVSCPKHPPLIPPINGTISFLCHIRSFTAGNHRRLGEWRTTSSIPIQQLETSASTTSPSSGKTGFLAWHWANQLHQTTIRPCTSTHSFRWMSFKFRPSFWKTKPSRCQAKFTTNSRESDRAALMGNRVWNFWIRKPASCFTRCPIWMQSLAGKPQTKNTRWSRKAASLWTPFWWNSLMTWKSTINHDCGFFRTAFRSTSTPNWTLMMWISASWQLQFPMQLTTPHAMWKQKNSPTS